MNTDLTRRRTLMLGGTSAIAALGGMTAAGADSAKPANTPQWDIFELTLAGPRQGNPFRDVTLTAVFALGQREVEVQGFYDGGGQYKLRFMPDTPGLWQYRTASNVAALSGHAGQLHCTAPRVGVHGPVRVHGTYHFAHADGTPFLPFGTTSYAWNHQGEALQQRTLATLAASPFNKLRMCVFPKHYDDAHNEPPLWPFERTATGGHDVKRPNPAFFRRLEQQVGALAALGIEADLILFHPYERWGFNSMAPEDDACYLRYVVARLAAHRNVWWSLANEFDYVKSKSTADFDALARTVAQCDPYGHLRSIHHAGAMYDYTRNWATHASLQRFDFSKTAAYLAAWGKPVVWDEVQYEGNMNRRWGDLSGEEQTWRFWRGVIAGSYVGHGETVMDPAVPFAEESNSLLWLSQGGSLRGSSPPRIAFLKKMVHDTLAGAPGGPAPRPGLQPAANPYYPHASVLAADGSTVLAQLYFLDYHQPLWYEFPLPEGRFAAELIDPLAMTVTPVAGIHRGKTRLRLTGQPYQALRFTRLG